MSRCEDAQMLISASLDDELTIEDRLDLEAHLQECTECRRVESTFEQVNRLICQDVDGSVERAIPVHTAATKRARWIGVAAAAAVVVLTTFAVLMRSPRASANSMMVPLAAAREIDQHKQAAQETVLKTLEWDLRALRLELTALKANATQTEALAARLENLLQRVDQVKQSYALSGELP